MAEMFHVETSRLVLRDWRAGDIDRFAQVTNTPSVMRWLGGVMDADKVALFEERVIGFQERLGHTFWIMERKADGGDLSGEMLGFCGLKVIDAPGAAFAGEMEIGWRMRDDAWGQGYAKEAAAASLDAGFDRFGAAEIFAITNIENTASWGLMTRLGMVRREDLDFVDTRFAPPTGKTIVHSISAGEWRKQPI
ncbi:GCN5 family acetyltransferase [Novosphingobium barchaimii LL02]|uniref:GCN5 family acetyltransferase n=2 Tax=Novosphingobium barchaimii TaxID=1420591 RepID=A0A0J7XP37_9SPHN|nr:GNAT family N-acetyltransferase [Novosphingobium barchaimii]KMS52848.1 GCN5 family acetyltransferase [Novosphingobium barchaimii LL02]